jgi:heme/copper-type cytochrome/quinol oxidase subunit 2
MGIIKKVVGFLCMLLAPTAAYLLTSEGLKKIAAAAADQKTNATTQWSILILIFLPVMAGLLIFGWYAVKGEFEDAAV